MNIHQPGRLNPDSLPSSGSGAQPSNKNSQIRLPHRTTAAIPSTISASSSASLRPSWEESEDFCGEGSPQTLAPSRELLLAGGGDGDGGSDVGAGDDRGAGDGAHPRHHRRCGGRGQGGRHLLSHHHQVRPTFPSPRIRVDLVQVEPPFASPRLGASSRAQVVCPPAVFLVLLDGGEIRGLCHFVVLLS
jgi:hypothetical protein